MDEKFVFSTIDKFNSSEIAELEFSDGNNRLVLKRKYCSVCMLKPDLQMPAEKLTSVTETQNLKLRFSAKTEGGELIKSPIVATFYSSPGHDAPPFVKPGSKVKAGQTLCILEAMKMMNHLEAEFDCEIVNVHAGNGELVEYEQELFTVIRN